MGYKGLTALVQLGQGGMYTDDAPSNVPVTNLIKCRNCIIDNGSVLNEPGSIRWNKSQIYYDVVYDDEGNLVSRTLDGSGIVAMYDWFPVQDLQYTLVVTRIGKVYRFQNQYEYVEITANQIFIDANGETAPESLSIIDQVVILQCGQELAGLPRKLFIFTGGSQVQVISGTNTTRTNISNPAKDWKDGNYPFAGILFNGRVFAWGNPNFPHNVYASDNTVNLPITAMGPNGNEDFVSDAFNINVTNIFPGEGQKVVAGFNYKGRLQIAKYPRGLYYLNIPTATDPTTWYYSKLSDDLGTTSPLAICNVYDDYWMMNNVSSITSMSAALTLGQMTTADILKQSKVSNFFAQIISPLGIGVRQALFCTQTKKAYFLTRKTSFDVAQRKSIFENLQTNPPIINTGTPGQSVGAGENVNSMMVVFDFSSETQKIMYSDKDQANCMALIKNNIGVDELFFGSEDGYIYKTGRANRAIKWNPPEGQISLAIQTHGGSHAPTGISSYGITDVSFPTSGAYGVSFVSGANSFNLSGSGYGPSNVVIFSGSGLPSPLITGTPYYLLGLTGSSGQVSSAANGEAVSFSSSGSGMINFSIESVLGAISTNLLSNAVPTNFSVASGSPYVVGPCLVTGTNKEIILTNVPLSVNPYVTMRNLYRCSVVTGAAAPAQVYNLLYTFPDNTSTSFTDSNSLVTPGPQTPPFISQDGFSAPYVAEFQTPHMDLTQTDIMTQSTVRADKNYDFLELEYLPTGASNVSVDIYIDGAYSQTQSFYLGKAPQLDSMQLDNVRLQGGSVRSQRLPIVGRGRTISFRVYASILERVFNITAFRVYFRMAGHAEKT